jgi:multidrug efflux pump
MSRFFINRPIMATVISIVIMIAGFVSFGALPVSRNPEITPPVVQVTTSYPGANPQVIAETVATPIEQEVNGVEDMIYMSSTCASNGAYTLQVTFEIGTDLDMATVLVQNRVSIATPRLPEEVRRQGVTTRKQSTQILQFVTLTSPDGSYNDLYLSNYALRIKDELSRINGVGFVSVFGAGDYGMRVWLNPEKLKNRSLTTDDVVAAISEQNVQVAAGSIGAMPAPSGTGFEYTINTLGRLREVAEFENIIVKTGEEGRITRVKDVGRVERGAKEYLYKSEFNGSPSCAIAVYQLPGANALNVADQVREKMEELKQRFPEGLQYDIPFDTTRFVVASINEVYETLFVAVVLVVIVIFIFLQDWRPTVIPCAAIPVSLIGTFAVMSGLGFSINMMSLFGIVLAIGIVVDDAIVVVENTTRHLEAGLQAKDAAITAMQEITGPVIATTAVLLAVFVPTAFMGGITGQLYRQFALTISAAVILSTVNALSLSPALCALLLKPKQPQGEQETTPEILPTIGVVLLFGLVCVFVTRIPLIGPLVAPLLNDLSPAVLWLVRGVLFAVGGAAGWFLAKATNYGLHIFFGWFNFGFDYITNIYTHVIASSVRRVFIVMVVFLGLVALTGWSFSSLPTGFMPAEDQGYVFVNVQLPDAASRERTDAVMEKLEKILKDTPGVKDRVLISGYSLLSGTAGSNLGMAAVILHPWENRTTADVSIDGIMKHLRQEFGTIKEAQLFAFAPPPIDGLGNASGFQMEVQDMGDLGPVVLQEMVDEMVADGNAQSGLTGLNTTFRANVPQLYADVDRTKVYNLGVPLGSVFNTLQAYLGSAYVNDFNILNRTYQVRLQADAEYRAKPDDIAQLDVRNQSGEMVPVGTVLNIQDTVGPQVIRRYKMYPSASINGAAAAGYSSGQSLTLMEQMADAKLPPGTMGYEWTGMSFQERRVGSEQYLIFLLAVVFVFLVLAAQYESWTAPAAVIAVVPLAALGVVIALVIRGMDNNTYTQIGVVLLVALASKNAILIVEFAREQRQAGLGIQDAAVKAANLRFRAILMTAFSSILGFVPLLVAAGAGAGSRQAVGTAVVGGMIAATIFSVTFVPSFFVVFQNLAELGRKPATAPQPATDETPKPAA